MDLLIILAITAFFGMVAVSAAAQRSAPAAQVIYVRTEAQERREASDTGISLLLFVLAILGAIWLF